MDGARTADGRRRWRVWGEDAAREALVELSRSGESVAEFARRRGISVQRVYYWKKRVAETTAPAFVAVALPTGGAGHMDIITEGVTIRVRDDLEVERLAAILNVVARRSHGC